MALGPDGWLDTGDIGYLDEDGYVFLVGRDGDVINRGGEKIAPREVEEILLAHPDVTAAVVIGRPHPTVGAEPVAFVIAAEAAELSPDVLAAQLSKRCEMSLSRFKRPVEIHVTSSLPSGPTGKIRRGEVASLVAAGVDPSGGRTAPGGTPDLKLPGDLGCSMADVAGRELHPSMGSH
jgi:acyl-coenzyme A synthetase/AMP-(fatty) acid ligase